VQQQVDAYGNASYVAWYEWFTPPTAGSPGYIWQTNIPNFPVSPGDTVFCSVQYLGSSAGYLYFYNSTSGVSPFSITLAPPPGATFDGESAEWIMECNDYGEYGGESLPAFTPINFTGCIACSQTTPSSTPLNGDTFIILTPQGQPLTDTVLGDGTVEITFIG
jgi:hypothetical protein